MGRLRRSSQWEMKAQDRQPVHDGAMAEDSSWNVGQYAAEILAPEWNVIGPDTAGIGDSLSAAVRRAASNPGLVLKAGANLGAGLASIPSTVLTDWIA